MIHFCKGTMNSEESLNNYQRLLVTAGWNVTYPFPEFCTCFGFFLVYAIEEITYRIFSEGHHHSHGPGGGHNHSHSNNGTVGPSHVERIRPGAMDQAGKFSAACEIENLKASCDTSTTSDGSTDTYMVVQTHE
uniref:Copper transporter n=1 Tax=Steinernema glaseri TaxID=37863 RepID=A0A1I8AJK3_9BILA